MGLKTLRTAAGTIIACAAALAALAACGGGGGGGPSGPVVPPDPPWTMNVYQSPASFAAYCASPRSGVDPVSGKPYPDKLGSNNWEDNWIRAWTHAYYLWYSEVVDVNPGGYTPSQYFPMMKTMATTASGAAKDRFHFTYTTSAWEQLSQSDVTVGYGVTWFIIQPTQTTPPQVFVAYVDAGDAAAMAGLVRGIAVITVDGISIQSANQNNVGTINAGLFPATAGESHTFVIQASPTGPQQSVTMVSANVQENPVPLTTTVVAADGKTVGYIEFNSHVATAEAGLMAAITQLKNAGVSDLVLDIRYNGGGYLDIASELAYMIAGPGPTAQPAFFEQETFNAQYGTTDPFTGTQAVTPFWSTSQVTPGQALPTLNLARVFVLTSGSTCSASEAIINGLRGVGISVIEVGTTTCGKPYGFYPADNCGTTYFSIQFQGNNYAGFGSYGDGFTPQNAITQTGVLIPGCSVADDLQHPLGNAAEAQFAAALGYRANGMCPTPSAFAPPTLHAGYVHRPEPLMNRILRQPR